MNGGSSEVLETVLLALPKLLTIHNVTKFCDEYKLKVDESIVGFETYLFVLSLYNTSLTET